MKSLEAINIHNNMVEIMCVVKEVKAYNGSTVIFHPRELSLDEVELIERKEKSEFEERRRKRQARKRNSYSKMFAAMALHTLIGRV